MKNKLILLLILAIAVIGVLRLYNVKKINPNTKYKVGQVLDSLDGVKVYFNGGVDNVEERNVTADNYNLGLKYQCVEFVKRYYYEHLHHKMPDSYGHAKDFFDKELPDGVRNTKRNLIQYKNPGKSKPQVGDLVIFSGNVFNRFGHVAIVSNVTDTQVKIIQQNPGPFGASRDSFALQQKNKVWEINNDRLLGWLRKE